ncbi:hydrolase [Pseudoclavibacter endophyticus]|uniref:Carbon-nitrogen family hydrolase n=1 Tax=Pseudoclavibacter endophyticus TaxID=1778590 RepID=A0A6H9WKX5_9MICO|nr:nitrilase-related carbon-nitrogen hydrolase [Pseudoclavibacter endophyticus]KAB1649803.1 carbon-nitrogen family hydrolase [Pseudoclavibacter endophyticus]GGA59632.1 hydrolase [Pseudoclavibacter endophyticus]
MRVAIIQIASPDDETIDERRVRVERQLVDVAPVDLIALTELWGVGFNDFDRYPGAAEPLDGPTVALARRVATERGCWVHTGTFIERDDQGSLHNTGVLVDPEGLIRHVARKLHVFGYKSREPEFLTPGDHLQVAETPFGRLAVVVCYDLRFPGLWQELSDRGAELVIVPAAWPMARAEPWRVLAQARAMEHQLWIIAANAAGVHNGVELAGSSLVAAPNGKLVESAGHAPGVTIAEFEPERIHAMREHFPVLGGRRDDYAALAPGATHVSAGTRARE